MAQKEVVLTRVSPMSAFRVALALSLVALVAWLGCVTILYFGLAAAGVWENVNSVIGGIGGDGIIGYGMVISLSALGGAVLALLTTALAPVGALIYNAVVDLFGGLVVEVQEN